MSEQESPEETHSSSNSLPKNRYNYKIIKSYR